MPTHPVRPNNDIGTVSPASLDADVRSPEFAVPEADSKGIVFKIQRFCLHDGPGIRTTVFLKGCPLCCVWCHNPEGRDFKPSVLYFEERCRHCGECIIACPHGAIREVDGKVETGPECELCGTCLDSCQTAARQISGKLMTVQEVIRKVEEDLVFFDESGGGVTFSGGEPLYQPHFLNFLLEECRKRKIHTVVETCGFVKPDILLSLKDKVGLFLFDVKILDPSKHARYTGVPNDLILENLEMLASAGVNVVVRVPLIPSVNDSMEEILQIGRHLNELGISRIHLLPYHNTGSAKYARLKLTYSLEGLNPPSPESVLRLVRGLEGQGLNVTLGGHS